MTPGSGGPAVVRSEVRGDLQLRRVPLDGGAEWDEFVAASRIGSIYQSTDYAEVYAIAGWKSELLVLRDDREIRGGTLISWKQAPLVGRRLARVENGFLLADPADEAAAGHLWSGIRQWCQDRRVGLLDVRPHQPRAVGGVPQPAGARLDSWLRARGCRHSAREGGGTYWLDLTRSEEELFGRTASHFRRHVRRARRAGCQVRFTFDPTIIDPMFECYMSMQRRKRQKVSYPPEFFRYGIRHLLSRRRCVVAHTETRGSRGSYAVIGLPGVPRYMLGASVPTGAAPPAGHLLHWEIARWLKDRGHPAYDLGGAPGPVPREDHPNFGVWRFKHDMRGDYVDYVGNYELVFSKAFRLIFRRGLPLYRWLRGTGD